MTSGPATNWIETYQRMGALWIHDENPKRPHALLTSGKHSNGFFNSGLVAQDPRILSVACQDLVVMLRDRFDIATINRVVGPAMGAITMSHCVAMSVNQCFPVAEQRPCLSAFTEKEEGSGKIMSLKRTTLAEGEIVLPVEDVLTTGGSAERSKEAIICAGGTVVPFICVLVNRSGLQTTGGMTIIALIDKAMPMWEENTCPLCQQGSEAIRPKAAGNWARLNADY
jgi:orotate phosphoribosyltransferase